MFVLFSIYREAVRLRDAEARGKLQRGRLFVEYSRFRNYNHGVSAKDVIYDAVQSALVKDGWTLTDDPLIIVRTETEEIVKWKS